MTGGGSGIGRALAEALYARGDQLVVTGRNAAKLEVVQRANLGIITRELNVDDPARIRAFAQQIVYGLPALNVLVNRAGIMRPEDLRAGDTETADATIATNLLGPIRMNASLLPHF